MGIDLKRAVTFYRQDPDSLRKLALGGVVGLVPVLGWAAILGVGVEVYRNVVQKGEEPLLPEPSEFGSILFRGLSAAAALVCYVVVFGFLYLLLSLPLAFLVFGAGLGGNHIGGQIWLSLVGLLVYLAFNIAAWMALARFAETLEVASCFQLLELAERVTAAGRNYLLVVMLWTLGSSTLAALSSLVPWNLPSLALVSFLGFPLFLSCVHALAQAVGEGCEVGLCDPLDWAPSAPADFSSTKSAGPTPRRPAPARGPKASTLVDRPSETVLTWSTDSDRPDSL
ncbi:MAG: DUF4013 domain-containing protein [Candidatus Xenobium sp.]|jgi:hypothetical protein